MSLANRLLASTAPAPGAVEPPKPKPAASTRQRVRAPRRSAAKPRRRDQPKRKADDSGDADDGDGDELPPHAATIAVLRKSQVCAALAVSTWTLDRWIRQGLFPPPLFLTPSSNVGVWKLGVVADFLEKRRRARRVKPKPKGMFLRSRKRAQSRGAAS
jgi:predicted DNA-binding transcriptional regulator AlpA